MQLVYRWNIGNQILEASLQKITQFLVQPSLFAKNTEGEESICVNMDVKRMKIASTEQSSSSSSSSNQSENENSTTASSKGKKNKKTKKGKQTSPRDEKEDEKDQMKVNEGTQLHVSLSQALSILQAVVDDSISQSTAYSPELLTTTLTVLEPLLPALQQYAFPLSTPSTTTTTTMPTTSVLEVFFNLIALKVRIEMFQAVSASLESNAEMMKSKARANEQGVGEGGLLEMRVNPLIGKVPTTLNDLRVLLSKQLVTVNSMGM